MDAETTAKLNELRKSIIAPYFTKVITGEESIDKFDSYVQEWMDAGGKAITETYNKLFQETGKKEFTVKSFLPENHPAYTGKYLFDGKE